MTQRENARVEMDHIKPRTIPGPPENEGALDYLIDMLHEMAAMARRSGEDQIAIHLEAIIAAQRAIAKDRSEQPR